MDKPRSPLRDTPALAALPSGARQGLGSLCWGGLSLNTPRPEGAHAPRPASIDRHGKIDPSERIAARSFRVNLRILIVHEPSCGYQSWRCSLWRQPSLVAQRANLGRRWRRRRRQSQRQQQRRWRSASRSQALVSGALREVARGEPAQSMAHRCHSHRWTSFASSLRKEPSQSVAERCVERMKEDATPRCLLPRAGPRDGGRGGGDRLVDRSPHAGLRRRRRSAPSPPNLIPQAELFHAAARCRTRRRAFAESTAGSGRATSAAWSPATGRASPSSTTRSTRARASVQHLGDRRDARRRHDRLFLPTLRKQGRVGGAVHGRQPAGAAAERSRCAACTTTTPRRACMHHYLSEFLLHGVLFRPADDGELDRLQQFATTILATEAAARRHRRAHPLDHPHLERGVDDLGRDVPQRAGATATPGAPR